MGGAGSSLDEELHYAIFPLLVDVPVCVDTASALEHGGNDKWPDLKDNASCTETRISCAIHNQQKKQQEKR